MEEEYIRSPFRRDLGRLIHSAAFRRLQGKTQLFPISESDFFRNRLTHSLEVAQIAKSIAILINKKYLKKEIKNNNVSETENYLIDYDLVEFAALAHDLGHPPFGHQGESALDECMKEYGGFESNAQTLHILTRLEKKEKLTERMSGIESGIDKRLGLNLTYRTLASILKHDREIPLKDANRKKIVKGYYHSEREIVKKIKEKVTAGKSSKKFKTLECQIMDIADDIAYSTYDLEDAFKTKFLSPMVMLSESTTFLEEVARSVSNSIQDDSFQKEDVVEILNEIFKGIAADFDIRDTLEKYSKISKNNLSEYDLKVARQWASEAFNTSNNLCRLGYERTRFTSHLVNSSINSIEFEFDHKCPSLSKVSLKYDTRKEVEVLKRFIYLAVVQQSRLQLVEGRGRDIIFSIFIKIDTEKGDRLLPPDFHELYNSFSNDNIGQRKRVIADFIACMTDRYAIEFYKRLFSVDAETIFKEL